MNCITRFLTRIHTLACFRLHVAAFPPIGPEVGESCVNLRDGDRCGLLISEARRGYWEGTADLTSHKSVACKYHFKHFLRPVTAGSNMNLFDFGPYLGNEFNK